MTISKSQERALREEAKKTADKYFAPKTSVPTVPPPAPSAQMIERRDVVDQFLATMAKLKKFPPDAPEPIVAAYKHLAFTLCQDIKKAVADGEFPKEHEDKILRRVADLEALTDGRKAP